MSDEPEPQAMLEATETLPKVPTLEAISVSLDALRSEYEAEHTRARTYEGRTGMLLSLTGALLAFEGSRFTLPKSPSDHHPLLAHWFIVAQISSLGFLVLSMMALMQVIRTRTFHRIPIEDCRGDFDKQEEVVARGLLREMYYIAIERTSIGIRMRTFYFTIAIWLLMGGIILVVTSNIFSVYIGKGGV